MLGRWVGVALALAAGGLHAQPDVAVPAELENWRDWALHDHEYRRCPFLFDSSATTAEEFLCAWPGELELDVDAEGGRFAQDWTVYGDGDRNRNQGWVPLPGSAAVWPQQVSAGGRGLEVVQREGFPVAYLSAGRHRITGEFTWDERPATLDLPVVSRLLSLTVDGARIRFPSVDARGVWFGDVEPIAQVPDGLAVRVFRRVVDTIPTRLHTVIRLDVSGTVREETLGPALPAGFVPLALASDLPTELRPDGNLRVQARPGNWEISLSARADGVLDAVVRPSLGDNMPAEEIWSFQAAPGLRASVADAARPVDPTQVGSPWTELPAFRMGAGETLTIEERRRGLADIRNEIDLSRRIWLDFDGGGFVFADRITGRMRTQWRLDMAAPFALLGANEGGDSLQITSSDAGAGIEVRQASLDVEALGRVETRGRMPVVGWQSDVRDVKATLHVPPGHKLLAATGVDAAPTSWVSRWRLLDFFVLLIATVATARLFGRAAAVVALAALVLSYHEPGAPIWTWLNLLAAVALVRVAPAGRLARMARSYRLASLLVLLVWLVPFTIGQIRIAVYPQLEPERHRVASTVGLFEVLSGDRRAFPPVVLPVPPALAVPDRVGDAMSERETDDVSLQRAITRTNYDRAVTAPPSRGRVTVNNQYADADAIYSRYADDALIQAGTGKPDWSWTPYDLAWSGPVDSARAMRLLIAPAWLVGALRFAAIAALAGFAAFFAFDTFGVAAPNWRQLLRTLRRSSGALALVLGASMLDPAGPAHAQTPSPEILEELERRLLAPPSCAPRCAEIADVRVDIGEDTVTMQLEVHAAAEVAVPMPGSDAGWRPTRIEDSLSQALAARADERGVLWVHLAAGIHTLAVSGPLPPGDVAEISFDLSPRSIEAESRHWDVAGIENRTLRAGSLNLTRLRSEEDVDAAAWEPGRLPMYLAVERTIRLDLDWEVETVVRRIAPQIGAINATIPLLEGESVVSDQSLTDGGAAVAMDLVQQRTGWTSTLPLTSTLTLQAPADMPWREIWRLRIGHMWKVDFEGVPENNMPEGRSERWAAFSPRPGESLALRITRPDAVRGKTLAFDRVVAKTAVGGHLRRTTLDIEYRSTRGGTHRLGLPADARLQSVVVDGEALQLALEDGQLELPIRPGEHMARIRWEKSQAVTARVTTPTVDLGTPTSNIVVGLDMPESRWLLFTTGPVLGPAILYWSEFIALVLVALLLGRFRFTPLRWWHWLLLGLGFSTFSWPALAVVALWLLAFGARPTWAKSWTRLPYNLSQIGLGLLTLAAFAAILIGIPAGLLGNPDMHVTGYQSGGHSLNWFTDQTDTTTPSAAVWSLPMWTYKTLILAWALWLSFALVRWLPWVWERFVDRGLWVAEPPLGAASAPEAKPALDAEPAQ